MTDEETPPVRPVFRFRDTVAIKLEEAEAGSATTAPPPALSKRRRRGLIARLADQEWSVSALLLLLDVTAWLLIYGFTGLVRGDAFYGSPFVFFVVDLLQLTVIVSALFTIGGYDRNTETRSLVYATEHLLAISVAAIVSTVLIYAAATYDQTMKPSRGVVLVSFVIFLPVSLEFRRWLQSRVTARIAERAYLVIGSGVLARQFYEAYMKAPNQQQLRFLTLKPEKVGQPLAGPESPILHGDLLEGRVSFDPIYSGIILAEKPDALDPGLLDRLVRTQFQQTRVYTLESFYESHWRYVPLEAVDPVWPLQTGFQLAQSSPYHYTKRLCDVLASAFGMIVFAPVLLLAAGLVWATSGRPIFFHQVRVGRAGRPFTLSKLRTMLDRVATDESDEIYTRKGDPRITPIGRWLRKLRLDELPQLWNVFKGEMSLIGPRAEWIKCAERYETQIPFYHFRHLVKPGITGWAQVNYPYGESDQDAIEKLKFDLYYIRRYSLKLDAMIALKTIHVMLFSRGQ